MRKIIRTPEVLAKLGQISETTFWRIRKKDITFPKPIQLPTKGIAWREDEIDAWIEALPDREV